MLSLFSALKPAMHGLALSKVLEPLTDLHEACRSVLQKAAQRQCLAAHFLASREALYVSHAETGGVPHGCRLLDDNRELFVPELRETVKPHPHFMLFATQNPPGERATWSPAHCPQCGQCKPAQGRGRACCRCLHSM